MEGSARKTEREGQAKGGERARPAFESLGEKEGKKVLTELLLWDRGCRCLNWEGSAHRTGPRL